MTKRDRRMPPYRVSRAASYILTTFGIILVLMCQLSEGSAYADANNQSRSISCDETREGRVGRGEEDRWTFRGSSDDVVTISMEETDGMDTYLELFGPDGDFLTEDDDSGHGEFNSRIDPLRLPSAGTYIIVAHGFDHEGGSYRLTLSCDAPGGSAESIGCDETVRDRVAEGSKDRWTFRDSSDDVVTISMEETDGMDTYLELYGPDDDLLTWDDDGGGDLNSRIHLFHLPSAGTYTIVARGSNRQGGSYRLSLSCYAPSHNAGSISCDDTVRGRVAEGGEDRWTFRGSFDDVVTISMEETDGMDTYVVLYGPSGHLLTQDDNGGGDHNSRTDPFRLSSTGTYTIAARGLDRQGGSYRLSLSCYAPSDSVHSISCDETVRKRVADGGEDRWTFRGSSNDVVTISMNETDGMMDTYLELYGPDGDYLTADDDGGQGDFDSRIERFQLPTRGTYTIVAQGFDHNGGSYRLSLDCDAQGPRTARAEGLIQLGLGLLGLGCCPLSSIGATALILGALLLGRLYRRR